MSPSLERWEEPLVACRAGSFSRDDKHWVRRKRETHAESVLALVAEWWKRNTPLRERQDALIASIDRLQHEWRKLQHEISVTRDALAQLLVRYQKERAEILQVRRLFPRPKRKR